MVKSAPYRFSLTDYERMVETGIFPPDVRLELIRGEVVQMAPMGSSHFNAVIELTERLGEEFRGKASLAVQLPLHIAPHSQPQPDFMLLRLPKERYRGRIAEPADVLWLIEVSDSTLLYDKTTKLALYAEANIEEVWIVNLQEDKLEVFRHPQEDVYRTHLLFFKGEPVAPLAFPDVPVVWDV